MGDYDPTTDEGQAALGGGLGAILPFGSGAGAEYVGAQANDRMRRKLQERLGHLADDPAVLAEAAKLYTAESAKINAGAARAGAGSAAAYSRRGLGASGMSAGAQNEISLQAASARAEAQQRAQEAAMARQQRIIEGQMGYYGGRAAEGRANSRADEEQINELGASALGSYLTPKRPPMPRNPYGQGGTPDYGYGAGAGYQGAWPEEY